MTSYTEKLEDTIWCNDRNFYEGSLSGKDINADDSSEFSAYDRNWTSHNYPSVICSNEKRDGFTVSTVSGGNGTLIYPVGLLTADEIRLAGGYGKSHYLYTGQNFWTLSPSYISNSATGFFHVSSGGELTSNSVSNGYAIRPSVSLAKGTRYTDGDGTADNPYVIGDE